MPIKVLVNPASGNGLGKKLLMQHSSVPMQATDPLNLDQQLKNFLIPGDILIIAGGDGTVHLLVNALYRTGLYTQVKVALLPLGTGNDLAAALQYPRLSLDELMSALSAETIKHQLPLWGYGDLVFCSYLSFGLDAKILSRVTQWRKYFPQSRWITLSLYFLAGLLGLFLRSSLDVEINQKKNRVLAVIFCNIRSYAGGALIAKETQTVPTLAMVAIKSRWQFIQLMLTRFTKKCYPAEMMRSPLSLVCRTPHQEADGELITTDAQHIFHVGELHLLIPTKKQDSHSC